MIPQFRVLYFDMNSFFASVEQQEAPELIGHPVAVVTNKHRNACCIAASYEAKRHGVRMGVPMWQAQAKCPDIVFKSARHDLYVDYHHRIRMAVERVYPISKAYSVDEFSCILPELALPEAMALAEDIRAAILREVGLAMRCSIGLGTSRLLAKIAAELHKPAGLEWLCPAVMPGKIAHLQLTDLPGISKRMEKRLIAAGINDVGLLYRMAPAHARHVWHSVEGERFVRALQGEDIPDLPTGAPHSFGHGQILTPRNRDPENARLVARRLLLKAATRMRRAEFMSGYLGLTVKCARYGRQMSGGSMVATRDSFQLLGVFTRYWSQFRVSHPLSVGVFLGGLVSKETHVADLFETRSGPGVPTRRENLCFLVDKLNQRYGADTVYYGQKPADSVPYTGAKIAFGRIPDKVEFRD